MSERHGWTCDLTIFCRDGSLPQLADTPVRASSKSDISYWFNHDTWKLSQKLYWKNNKLSFFTLILFKIDKKIKIIKELVSTLTWPCHIVHPLVFWVIRRVLRFQWEQTKVETVFKYCWWYLLCKIRTLYGINSINFSTVVKKQYIMDSNPRSLITYWFIRVF